MGTGVEGGLRNARFFFCTCKVEIYFFFFYPMAGISFFSR